MTVRRIVRRSTPLPSLPCGLTRARLYRGADALRLDNHKATHTVRLMRIVGARGESTPVPRQHPPIALEREYAARIRDLVIEPARRAFEPLFAELPRLVANALRERSLALHADAGEGRRVRELVDRAREELNDAIQPADLERLARVFAGKTQAYNRDQLSRQVQHALGADVFAADRALKPLTEAFVDANVGLIKNVGDKLATDIETTTMRAIQDGKLHGDLAEELEAKFGFAEDRAALIARDQIGKAYGQVNAARQREIGVTKFIWRTVHDDRVRQEHEDRDGETYEYSDPPDGELPGEPINCRCYAEPVFDDILAELDNL